MRFVAIDIEAIGLDITNPVIWMLSVTEGKKTQLFHDCNGMKKCPKEIEQILRDESICKIIHSSQYDCPYMEMAWGIKTRNVWDTELQEIVIQGVKLNIKRKGIEEGSPTHRLLQKYGTALEFVLPRYGFPKPDKSIRENFIDRPKGIPFTKMEIQYAKDDTKYLPAIQKAQEYLLKRDDLWELALLENKVAERYHDMKVTGIGFDESIWASVADANEKELSKRMAKLPKTVGNWNSEKQVKEYFKKKGILIDSYDNLDKIYLKTRNADLGNFIATRELSKSVSAYGKNWFTDGYIDSDKRIRTSMTQIINTGRNASSDPNLQQLPGSGNNDPMRLKVLKTIGVEKSKPLHRSAFVPKKDHVFVIGDFSGQEIGIMAAASEEKLWIDALLRGDDVHSLTASVVDNTAWQRGTEKICTFPKKCKCAKHKDLRDPAKINNFMLAYGGGAAKFADFTGTDMLTATAYVAAHKRVIPRLTAYLQKSGRDAMATGVSYSASPYRRRRVLRGEEPWQIRNQGMNHPIQGAGADMLKLALASIPWNYTVILLIHDEIILEVPKVLAKEACVMLKSVMEKSADYITGIAGLIKVEPRVQMNIMKDLPEGKMSEIGSGKVCYVPKL
jgi:DNA polymerase-1